MCEMITYAFATIVYKNAESAYAAAVLGQSLRLMAPYIPRYVITYNISESEELFLSQNKWIVEKVLSNRTHFFKFYLWLLPVERIMYFDADHLPMHSSHHILKLVNISMSANLSYNIMASPYDSSHPRCFNGGFLILQPNKQIFHTLMEKMERFPKTGGVPIRSFSQVCRNHASTRSRSDQILLHHTFQNWTSTKPLWKVNSFYRCKSTFDSFHFFRNTRPWEHVLCSHFQPNVTTFPPHRVCVDTRFQHCCSYFGLYGGFRGRIITSCQKELSHVIQMWWKMARFVIHSESYIKLLHDKTVKNYGCNRTQKSCPRQP